MLSEWIQAKRGMHHEYPDKMALTEKEGKTNAGEENCIRPPHGDGIYIGEKADGMFQMMKKNRQRIRQGPDMKKNLPLLVGIFLFLAVLAVCITYIRLAATPMVCYEIGPSSAPGRWRFTLEDGTVLEPREGKLPLEGTNNVVVCETDIMENDEDLPLIVVASKSSDCVFFLDGQMIYSPSGRYQNGTFSDAAFSTASGQFGLPGRGAGKKFTMIVQFQGAENRLSRMPRLTFYPSVIHYYSQYTGPVASDAFPAGVYFMIALFIGGLYLIGVWKQKSDPGLILLAICSLAMAFQRTASYNYGVMGLLGSPSVTWFCTALPHAAMSWNLWYRLSKKIRLVLSPLPALTSAAMVAFLASGGNYASWVTYMHMMTAWILPVVMLILLLVSAVDAWNGNLFLRRFFRFLEWSIPVVALFWGFSLVTKGELAESLKNAFASLTGPNPTLYYLCVHLTNLLLIQCFIQAILELISSIARQDTEMQTMALRERHAADNLEMMRQSQEETRRQRHEMQHHLTLLREMLAQGQYDRSIEYTQSLLDHAASLPSGHYSDNLVINAIVGYYLNMAKTEGVRVETEIKVENDPPLKDEELCVLLTNLLENAVEACRSVGTERDRFLSLQIASRNDHVMILCENSTDFPRKIAPDGTIATSKADGTNHGYGIPAIRRIVEKHYGLLETSCEDGCFRTVITI